MTLLESVQQVCANLTDQYAIPDGLLYIRQNKDGSHTVWLKNPTTLRDSSRALKFSESTSINLWLTDKTSVLDNIELPMDAKIKKLKSDPEHTCVIFETISDSSLVYINSIIAYCIDKFDPDDKFGCCSKYVECSNAKMCLHENRFYSKACWYRHNLDKGIVFYGVNKNK